MKILMWAGRSSQPAPDGIAYDRQHLRRPKPGTVLGDHRCEVHEVRQLLLARDGAVREDDFKAIGEAVKAPRTLRVHLITPFGRPGRSVQNARLRNIEKWTLGDRLPTEDTGDIPAIGVSAICEVYSLAVEAT